MGQGKSGMGMGMGEGKVERAEGVLTLRKPMRASSSGVKIGFV